MRLSIPPFPSVPGLQKILQLMIIGINEDTGGKLDKGTTNSGILLSSPNGNVWNVHVTDAGAIQVTKTGTASST